MKNITLIISFLTISFLANAQGWMWSTQLTGTGNSQPIESASDALGNIYVLGNFNGTVSQGAFTLNAVGNQDVFIAKYNKNGQILWLKQIAGATVETAANIRLSSDENFLFLTIVSNSNPTTFDGNNIAGTGLFDIYIAKFAVDGTYQWAHNSVYGATTQVNTHIAIENNGNIILSGRYLTNATFYGGSVTLTSASSAQQNFISKFDSNGNIIWAKTIVGDNTNSGIQSIESDVTGYSFGGNYFGTLTLDISVLSNAGNRDIFIYKTDTAGNGIWVRKIVGVSDDMLMRHKGSVDGSQYLTGYFNSAKLTIDSTSTDTSKTVSSNVNPGKNDIFIVKYSGNGTLQWERTVGTSNDDYSYNLDVLNGNTIITGCYNGLINFDNYTLTNDGLNDAFVAECNSTGQFISANKASGKANDAGRACTYGLTGRSFVTTGEFFSDTLNIGLNQFYNPNTLTRDAYIAKYGCFDSLSISSTNVTCYGLSNGTATVTPSEGSAPYSYLWSNSSTNDTITGITAGTYYVTVTGANNCTAIDSVTITQPNVLTATTTQNNGCNGVCNKSATAVPSGGAAPFTYIWNNAQTTVTATGLCAGSYSVTVTDACNNTTTSSVTITEPTVLNANTSVSYPTSGCNGTSTVTPTGGTGSYTYIWNTNPVQYNATAIGLCAGIYSVTVTDGNGCTLTKSVNTVPITKLRTVYCGLTTDNLNSYVLCDRVNGEQAYEFEFSNSSLGYTQVYSNPTSTIWQCYLNQVSGLLIGYTYNVRVRAKVNNIWGAWGDVCQVIISLPTTKLRTAYCGYSTNTLNTYVLCDRVTGEQSYEFEFSNSSLGYTQVYSNPTTTIWQCYLNQVTGLLVGYAYNVRVRAKVNNVWGSWGDVCQVTISLPTTKLRTAYCGFVTNTLNTYVLCDRVAGEQSYEFEFTNATLGYTQVYYNPTSTIWQCYLNQVPGLLVGYSYNVRVRAKVNNVWGTWGDVCQVTINIPTAKLRTAYCEFVTNTLNTYVLCDRVTGEQSYEFEFTNVSLGYTQVYSNPTSTIWQCYLNQVAGLLMGYTYDVRVRAKVNGNWGSYGTVCTVTINSSKSYKIEPQINVKVIAFPNPFSFNSTLLLEGNSDMEYTLHIYDITGKVISIEHIYCNKEYQVGENFNTGIYFLVITGEDYKETLKIVKTE